MSKKGFAMAGGAGAPGVEGADKSAATKAAEEQSNGAKEDAAKREQSTPASLLAGNSNGVSPAKEVLKPEPVKAVPETAPAPAIATSSEDTKAKADQPLQEASAEGKPKQRVHPLQHKW